MVALTDYHVGNPQIIIDQEMLAQFFNLMQ